MSTRCARRWAASVTCGCCDAAATCRVASAQAAAIDATDRGARGITSRMKSGLLKKNIAMTCMRMTAQEAHVSIALCARCACVRASLARMPAQPKLSIMSSRFRQYGLKQTNPRPVITPQPSGSQSCTAERSSPAARTESCTAGACKRPLQTRPAPAPPTGARSQASERVSLPGCVPDYANALNARHARADTRVSGSATAFAKAEKWLVYRLCKRVHAEDRETNAERRAPQQEHELPPVERRFWRRTHGHIRMR